MPFRLPPPCRRACSAARAALRATSAQPSSVQASCLERARPAIGAFAGGLAASSAAPPAADARSDSEGQRRQQRTWHRAASKASLHMGWRGTGASPPSPRGRTAMTDRRDDDFRVRPSAPKNRGRARGRLRFQGAQAGRKSQQRQVGGAPSWGGCHRPASRLTPGARPYGAARAKLTPMSRRVTIKTLLVNHQRASPQSLAKHLRYIERDGAGRDGEPGRAYGPGRRS